MSSGESYLSDDISGSMDNFFLPDDESSAGWQSMDNVPMEQINHPMVADVRTSEIVPSSRIETPPTKKRKVTQSEGNFR